MAYNSFNGKRPIEYASKINHSAIINSLEIQNFLNSCQGTGLDVGKLILPKANDIKYGLPKNIKRIFAIDGSYNETFLNAKFPSVSLAYFNIGVLAFDMLDYEELKADQIVDPEKVKKLKEVSKNCFAIPTNNLLKNGADNFLDSVRISINDIFSNKVNSCLKRDSLNDILQWILFEEWDKNLTNYIKIKCPNSNCCNDIEFKKGEHIKICPYCKKEIFLSDYLTLYSLVNEVSGASGIVSFFCSVVEQLYIAEIIRHFYNQDIKILSEIVFIKDGPLAFFSKTFKLCEHFRHLFTYLDSIKAKIYLVGLEKSGTFCEHANLIKDRLNKGQYYIFNEEYIRKYVEPQITKTIYGSNTYYGKKIMFKTEADDILIAVLPVKDYQAENNAVDLIGAEVCLKTISKLRCNMYDNSLVPISIINKLVSIAALPSANILKNFSKRLILDENK